MPTAGLPITDNNKRQLLNQSGHVGIITPRAMRLSRDEDEESKDGPRPAGEATETMRSAIVFFHARRTGQSRRAVRCHVLSLLRGDCAVIFDRDHGPAERPSLGCPTPRTPSLFHAQRANRAVFFRRDDRLLFARNCRRTVPPTRGCHAADPRRDKSIRGTRDSRGRYRDVPGVFLFQLGFSPQDYSPRRRRWMRVGHCWSLLTC